VPARHPRLAPRREAIRPYAGGSHRPGAETIGRPEQFDPTTAWDIELEPGQMSMHDVYLIHGSNPNPSPRRRAGVAIRYMPATSHFDRGLMDRSAISGYTIDFANRPIWLLRGQDRTGRNDSARVIRPWVIRPKVSRPWAIPPRRNDRLLQRFPDLRRGERHLNPVRAVGMSGTHQGVGDGVDDRRRRPDGAELADPLGAERVVPAGDRLVEDMGEIPDDVGSRHHVIHEARRRRLAGLTVIGHLLAQRLADALDGAAVQLAAHDHRVDDAADIIGRDIGDDLDGAGLRIDLDLADMAPLGQLGPSTLLVASMKMRCSGCRSASSKRPMLRSVAGDLEDTFGIFDIGAGRFKRIAGELARRRDRRLEAWRIAEPATNSEREPALPKPEPRSVSPWTMRNLFDRHAEDIDDQLGIGGLDPLPMGMVVHRPRSRRRRRPPR